MTFEEALFQEDAKDINKLKKQTKNANAAKAEAGEANQDLQNKQNIANDMIKACQEIFGLKQGGTLGPKDIIAKIKADPSILDKIVANQGIMQQIGNKFPKETIEQLKTAPMLNAQEAEEVQPDKSEPAQINQEKAVPTTEHPTQLPEQNAANNQQGDANNIANNLKAKPTVDAINRGLSSGLSVDDLIAYLQTLKK